MATKKKPLLHLVSFCGELFPYDDEAFQTMKARHLTVFRLPEEMLPTLKHTLLRGLDIRISPFPDVYRSFMEFFIQKRLSAIPEIRTRPDRRLLYLAFDHKHLEIANPIIQEFGFLLGRFGIKVIRENRTVNDREGKPDRALVRLECKPDPDINPSVYFRDAIPSPEGSVRLNISNCASLVFGTKPSAMFPGRLALSLSFEDKLGDEWVQAFVREFNQAQIQQKQLVDVMNFLLDLFNRTRSYTPPVLPKTKRD